MRANPPLSLSWPPRLRSHRQDLPIGAEMDATDSKDDVVFSTTRPIELANVSALEGQPGAQVPTNIDYLEANGEHALHRNLQVGNLGSHHSTHANALSGSSCSLPKPGCRSGHVGLSRLARWKITEIASAVSSWVREQPLHAQGESACSSDFSSWAPSVTAPS